MCFSRKALVESNNFKTMRTIPGSEFLATMFMPCYARVFSLFNRSDMASIVVPMGSLAIPISEYNSDGFFSYHLYLRMAQIN